MKSKNKTPGEMRAAKRRWLNSHDAGYQKAMGNRHVQMIAIGGAIGTGLFWAQVAVCRLLAPP